MPELPEVETIRRGLAPAMVGQVIESAEIRRPDLRWPFPPRMAERLAGQRVDNLRRRSKYLLADLSGGETLLIHLGMSGRMTVAGLAPGTFHHGQGGAPEHDHVVFHMESGARITFNDPRRFSMMDLVAREARGAHRLLAGLGPEPRGNGFHADYLAAALRGRRSTIKAMLLDQRIVAGLGNIYVCEALFRAGISPVRQAGRISALRIGALVPAIREVLEQAIAAGGSSLRDFRQADGALGYFQHSFDVYGREGQPCPHPDCGATIRRLAQGGRSTFYCPACQR
ncbi:bifunctional DNA-formamidopyrimidine glycosylase/DNA-(apurinic or apyrimidinic site) lyase [Pontibaca methylaminivorans]|uniref:bifunctional DNA-formamidopyrimidine glycosylase/DNA-(apurinic or apyrimidinic site) lyase n=1 Tax=Pontibaca methylaminivorans TaxID=515897 RepID=UPI002FD88CF1